MKIKQLILSVAMAFPVMAEAQPLSLLQAFQKAQQYDATLRAAVADNKAQKEEINKSFAAFLPQVRVGAFEGRGITDSEVPGPLGTTSKRHSNYDSRNYSLSLRQSIFNKANFAEYKQAKADVAKSNAMLEGAQFNMASRVTGAYLDLLLSEDNVRYSKSQKISAQSQLEQAKKRYKAGIGTITEVSEANANLETVIAQELEWVSGVEYAKRALENITGVYTDTATSLDPSKLQLTVPLPSNVEAWISTAMEKNADIMAAQNEYLVVTQEVEKNNSGHYPTLDLVASRTHTQSDNNFTIGQQYDTDSIGLQLNVPLYTGGYVSSSVRQAVARLEQASEKLSEKQRSVNADVRKYFNEITNGIARIEAQSQSVASYETALVGTQKGYESGMRSNVDVLTAQEKLYSAKRDLARERYKLIYSRIQLKQVAGMLTESDIAEVNGWLTASLAQVN
jgi:TolC family type I secretion outer membrane protein